MCMCNNYRISIKKGKAKINLCTNFFFIIPKLNIINISSKIILNIN